MTTVHPQSPVRHEELAEGAVWRLVLAKPKGNVIDAHMTRALGEVFTRLGDHRDVKAVILAADGPNFSFGASIEEHLPGRVATMLADFHGLLRGIAAAAVPVVASVRGQCLGGGLELAAFSHHVVAAPDARLGQPEIRLGVLAPVASVLLPHRVGRGLAEDLCLSGRTMDGRAAHAAGLVDELADDPDAAAQAWVERHLLPHSAAALRHAVRALRLPWQRRLFEDLAEVERLYLEELVPTHDAEEGLRAFLEKRPPQWRNA